MGRHSQPDELDDGPVPESSPATPPKTTAVADLQLVLHNPRLLAGCLAAAIVPLVCYFVVILGLHKTSSWGAFIGAPMVLGGVLVGTVLDRAYARLAKLRTSDTGPILTEVTELKVGASTGPAGLGSRSVEGARP